MQKTDTNHIEERSEKSKRERRSKNKLLSESSLQSRAQDILIAVAVLGLTATVADGDADYREVQQFCENFRHNFALSRSETHRIVSFALKQIQASQSEDALEFPCAVINQNLTLSQKLRLFEELAEVLVADGRVHQSEEDFLDLIAIKLHLERALKVRFPLHPPLAIAQSTRWS